MRFSIVMPSYNQSRFVEAALESVLSQDAVDLEILFIDGGSTDSTMKKVEKYRSYLSCCISEKDQGQSDALNKGFSLATGDILSWVNTDDLLLPGALKTAHDMFKQNRDISWLLGNVVWIDAEDRIVKCWRGEGFTPGWMRLGLFAAGGPSGFFTRDLYTRVGGLNPHLHYQMDTELWWRFAMAGEQFRRIKGYTWGLRLHEDAKVSGLMFEKPDVRQRSTVAKDQAREREHVTRLTEQYRKYDLPLVRSIVSVARKLLSPRYILGVIETILFRGKHIHKIMERQSDWTPSAKQQ